MNKKLFSVLFLSVSILFTACRKELLFPDENSKQIIGEWQWVKSYGGWGGVRTQTSRDYIEKFIFESNGIYSEYKDDDKLGKSKYEITKGENGNYDITFDSRNKLFKKENFGGGKFNLYFFGGDSLSLYWDAGCNDCDINIYVKKK